jgi:hypothetical protein
MKLSPLFKMNLIQQIEDTLWNMPGTSKYKWVENYLYKWKPYQYDENDNIIKEGMFDIYKQDGQNTIDLNKTLHRIDDDNLIIQIALDLNIQIPQFIPAVKEFEVKLGEFTYVKVRTQFQKTCEDVFDNPSNSVTLAYTTLESLIEHIAEGENISLTGTLPKKVGTVLNTMSEEVEQELISFVKTLTNLTTQLEDLRSNKATGHGTKSTIKLIDNIELATFIVNATASIGLLLIDIVSKQDILISDEREIDFEEIPF